VMYAEIKEPLFTDWTDYDGRILSDEEWTGLFRDTVTQFCAENKFRLSNRLRKCSRI
jgi:hypothetical protein